MFELEISRSPGQSYVIQTSTDLVNWIPVTANVPEGSTFFLTIPVATNSQGTFTLQSNCRVVTLQGRQSSVWAGL
jgi:hypothetical protein